MLSGETLTHRSSSLEPSASFSWLIASKRSRAHVSFLLNSDRYDSTNVSIGLPYRGRFPLVHTHTPSL